MKLSITETNASNPIEVKKQWTSIDDPHNRKPNFQFRVEAIDLGSGTFLLRFLKTPGIVEYSLVIEVEK